MSLIRILVINPNSNASMTEGLRAGIEGLGYNNVSESLFTQTDWSKGPKITEDEETIDHRQQIAHDATISRPRA